MISGLITYALTCGGTDAELHDKEVTLTTSDVTGSQTAVFEYDPQNEPVAGDPPGPWDGYSLFTIDLSGIKDDIEDLQQQVSDLEDELEDCHDCWEEVVAALQEYDPEYDPDEGECPAPKVGEIVDHAKDCDDCKAEVVAKLQEYDPDFDPQTCEDIVGKIDEIEEEAEKPIDYPFPPDDPDNPDPDRYDNIIKAIKDDPLTDDDMHLRVEYYEEVQASGDRILLTYRYIDTTTESVVGTSRSWQTAYPQEHPSSLHGFKMLDYTTGKYEVYYKYWAYHYPGWWYNDDRYEETDSRLIGYGDPTHDYTVSKNS